MKVGRNGGKWRENNGIMIRIGGYRNGVGRWAIEPILRAIKTNRYKTGG